MSNSTRQATQLHSPSSGWVEAALAEAALPALVQERVGSDDDDPRLRSDPRPNVCHSLTGDPLEVTVDDLSDVIDLWAESEARTRAKVTSVVRAFWRGPKNSDLSTTASSCGHYDLSDLERAMEALARSRREDEEPTD